MAPRPRNIVLVGFMGAGKTQIGRILAQKTGRPFVDTDDEVAGEAGLPIPAIFESEGEAGFRERERRAIARVAKAGGRVIATGGGAVVDERNVDALRARGTVVYLRVPADELARRLNDPAGRPMLNGRPMAGLLMDREPFYVRASDHVVACAERTPEAVAEDVLRAVDSGDRSVEVGVEPPYRVVTGRGLLGRAADIAGLPSTASRVGIVSHPAIARRWAAPLERSLRGAGLDVVTLTFPSGESNKSPATVERLHRRLAAARFHRGDALVALGGGVVGDVTGYVASTYARGIGFVQVPTTLLAMVDAAIGGKTGVNLPEGKNLVGTFAQPRSVLCDLDTLGTLPRREFRGGLAEVAKYSFIEDPSLGTVMDRHAGDLTEALPEIVHRSAAIKARIVAADEKEAGIRAHLNYGHTMGHALEALGIRGGGKALHHGEAISIGMVFAAWVSVLLGIGSEELPDAHADRLERAGLPTAAPGVRWRDVERYLTLDKKYASGLRLVLLEAPGRPSVRGDIPPEVLRDAFRRVTAA